MYEHNLYSLRYLCTFSYSKNNSKFTGSLLKIYVCDVSKTLLSMKVKCVNGIQNRKHTGGAVQEKKAWNTVRVISDQLYLYINVISVLCNPNGTLFQTCLILHVWLKSIILVFANILNTFFSFFLWFLLVNMPSIIDFTHLSRTGVVIHKVSEIRPYTQIMFSS
jgi:hypothetical protein